MLKEEKEQEEPEDVEIVTWSSSLPPSSAGSSTANPFKDKTSTATISSDLPNKNTKATSAEEGEDDAALSEDAQEAMNGLVALCLLFISATVIMTICCLCRYHLAQRKRKAQMRHRELNEMER